MYLHSNFDMVNYSVPQGTVLGPLLFIIYINDLLEIKCEGSIFCFADNTAIINNDSDKTKLCRILIIGLTQFFF